MKSIDGFAIGILLGLLCALMIMAFVLPLNIIIGWAIGGSLNTILFWYCVRMTEN